jgi:paraquat-inducible protein A
VTCCTSGCPEVIDRTLAFAAASLVLLLVANAFPFMEFKIGGRVQTAYMITGIETLRDQGYAELGLIVAFTSLLAPALLIGCLIYLTAPLRLGWNPPFMKQICLAIEKLQPWSMMEVYMLGVIVSVVKLIQMADIVMGPAAFAFAGLFVTLTAAISVFDPHVIWERLES